MVLWMKPKYVEGKVLYDRQDQKHLGSGVVVFCRMRRETALNGGKMEVAKCGRN
jgi:hypothetical protein